MKIALSVKAAGAAERHVAIGPESVVVLSSELAPAFQSASLPAGLVLAQNVKLEVLTPRPAWPNKLTLLYYGLGVSAGLIAYGSGGPKWSIGIGAGVGVGSQFLLDHLKRRSVTRSFKKWLGKTPSGLYTTVTNVARTDALLSVAGGRSSNSTGRVLLVERDSPSVIGSTVDLR